MIVILMGVSGSGKTTIGTLLAQRTGATFADADDFHSTKNKAKMASGIPLNDDDRQPWLHDLNRLILDWMATDTNSILACSALKAAYRQVLSTGVSTGILHWVFLAPPPSIIAERLSNRHHDYMNPALLASQLATLEPPAGAICIANERSPSEVVTDIISAIDNA